MIVTHARDEVAGHAFMLEPNSQIWRRAHMELAIPYFFLTYKIKEQTCWISQTDLYWESNQLLGCCAQLANDDRFRVVQIALISPAWMNGSNGWEMDTIQEIWRSGAINDQPQLMQYVTCNGKRLYDRRTDTTDRQLVKVLAVENSGIRITDAAEHR